MSKFSKFLHKMHDVTQAGGSIRDMVILSPGMVKIKQMTDLAHYPSCKVEMVTLSIPCSQFSPGPKEWDYGLEEYSKTVVACVPSMVARLDDEKILDWLENLPRSNSY